MDKKKRPELNNRHLIWAVRVKSVRVNPPNSYLRSWNWDNLIEKENKENYKADFFL